jgi:hypothetical protein
VFSASCKVMQWQAGATGWVGRETCLGRAFGLSDCKEDRELAAGSESGDADGEIRVR